MAIPAFGFLAIEKMACALLLVASAIGLVHGAELWRTPWVPWATWEVGYGWLLCQAGLVATGGVAALGSRSFAVAAAGIVAGLIFATRVGAITVGPSLLVLLLITACSRQRASICPVIRVRDGMAEPFGETAKSLARSPWGIIALSQRAVQERDAGTTLTPTESSCSPPPSTTPRRGLTSP
jgi:hypothetical protein